MFLVIYTNLFSKYLPNKIIVITLIHTYLCTYNASDIYSHIFIY